MTESTRIEHSAKTKRAGQSRARPSGERTSMRRDALLVGPVLCILCVYVLQPASAFFNCFTPNMFKMGKLGHPGAGLYAGHPGERANWYPQAGAYQSYQNPMSRLFKPKWMGGGGLGGGLFGPKRWMDWRMNGANMNLYRPNQFAYWPPAVPVAQPSLALPGKQGYNQFSEQLNLQQQQSPYLANMQLLQPPLGGYNAAGSYGQSPSSQLSGGVSTNINSNNDGWSYPSVSPYPPRPSGGGGGGGGQAGGQSTSSYGGDSYSVSPNNYQAAKQQNDPYGTKGNSGTKTAKK